MLRRPASNTDERPRLVWMNCPICRRRVEVPKAGQTYYPEELIAGARPRTAPHAPLLRLREGPLGSPRAVMTQLMSPPSSKLKSSRCQLSLDSVIEQVNIERNDAPKLFSE